MEKKKKKYVKKPYPLDYPLNVNIVNNDGLMIHDRNFWARIQIVQPNKTYLRVMVYSNFIEPIKMVKIPIDLVPHMNYILKQVRGRTGSIGTALKRKGIKYSPEVLKLLHKNCTPYKNAKN